MALAETRDHWDTDGGTFYDVFTDVWEGGPFPDDIEADWFGFKGTADGVTWHWRTKNDHIRSIAEAVASGRMTVKQALRNRYVTHWLELRRDALEEELAPFEPDHDDVDDKPEVKPLLGMMNAYGWWKSGRGQELAAARSRARERLQKERGQRDGGRRRLELARRALLEVGAHLYNDDGPFSAYVGVEDDTPAVDAANALVDSLPPWAKVDVGVGGGPGSGYLQAKLFIAHGKTLKELVAWMKPLSPTPSHPKRKKSASEPKRVRASPEEAAAFFRQVYDAVIAHAETAAGIARDGDVAVLVVNLEEAGREAAYAAGWDGRTSPSLWRMDAGFRARMIKYSDLVTAAWLEGTRPNLTRVFVFFSGGTFLLNHTVARGFFFEPGSLDSEMV